MDNMDKAQVQKVQDFAITNSGTCPGSRPADQLVNADLAPECKPGEATAAPKSSTSIRYQDFLVVKQLRNWPVTLLQQPSWLFIFIFIFILMMMMMMMIITYQVI